ncbi:DUF4340 domain-containing protein [Chloroflexi bacterium CFX6]|nr:DUF4340 domain-containing protein [Chloroflexi bacterium CFX6]
MRRSTIVYLLLFAAVLGAAYYFNNRQATAEDETATETVAPVEYLFTSADGLPTRIRIESKAGEVVEVARNAENAWALILPEEAAADQGVVEAAAGQVSTLQILERVPGLAPEAAGLADPEYTMMFQFTGGVERNIQIGVLTPTERGYYARAEDGEVLIVSVSAVDSLLRLLTDPPYAPTAAPPPASPEAGSTTEATAAP